MKLFEMLDTALEGTDTGFHQSDIGTLKAVKYIFLSVVDKSAFCGFSKKEDKPFQVFYCVCVYRASSLSWSLPTCLNTLAFYTQFFDILTYES